MFFLFWPFSFLIPCEAGFHHPNTNPIPFTDSLVSLDTPFHKYKGEKWRE